ncbi:MAG TPA: universal stress protein [Gemmatimonadaceae bacterium]|nr:universal stress protein [Gemmatimonadaceae bacterium]
MFTKLLTPLDGSSIAEGAVGVAASIAQTSRAALDLLLVDQPFPFDGFGTEPWTAAVLDEEREYLTAVADQVARATSIPVTHAVMRGDPVERICQRIGDMRADLVVMTSHGRTGIGRMWLGSVADGVLRYATAPVLMLRGREGGVRELSRPLPFGHILVPVDGSAWSAEILDAASQLGLCSGAQITLLRIVPPVTKPSEAPVPFTYVPTIVDETATNRRAGEARVQLAEEARRLHDASGLAVDWHVGIDAQVANGILGFARDNQVDLIAMSTHGRGMSRYLLGSIADKVLRGSGLPMLLCRPLGARARTQPLEAAVAHA